MLSALEAYTLEFEDVPFHKPYRVGRTFKKMSNKSNAVEAPAKTYNKTKREHFKDMVIVALVVGIIAFGLGFKFNADRNSEMQSAVKAAQTAQVSADTAKK